MTHPHPVPVLRRRRLLGLLTAALPRAGGLRLAGGALTAGLAGCAQGGDLPVLASARSASYLLGIGDQVRVVTYGDEQLSDDYRVGDDGTIAVPLLGAMRAAGLSAGALGTSIAAALREHKVLRDASVTVEITAYRPIFVLGEVVRPGPYPFQPGMTMLTAATVAGGFTYRAVQDHAMVIRLDGQRTIEGRVLPGAFLQPGDVMKVYERYF